MIQMIKQTITYLKWDWPTLLLFELLHKLFALVVIIPLFFSHSHVYDAKSRFNLFKPFYH